MTSDLFHSSLPASTNLQMIEIEFEIQTQIDIS